jgi:hypothetical protein
MGYPEFDNWLGGVDMMPDTGYGTGGSYMPADTVDEQAADTGMAGLGSLANRAGGSPFATPTRSLVAMWFLALGAYWFLGWFFKGSKGVSQ